MRGTRGVRPDVGERRIDTLDAERVRRQLDGELPPEVTADQYAADQREQPA